MEGPQTLHTCTCTCAMRACVERGKHGHGDRQTLSLWGLGRAGEAANRRTDCPTTQTQQPSPDFFLVK